MKKFILFVMILASASISMAQVKRNIKAKATDSTGVADNTNPKADKVKKKDMLRDLNLTKEQYGKMKEINQANKAKRDDIMNDEKLTDTERKQKLRELRKAQMESTDNILDADQRAKMKELRKAKMKEGRDT